MKPYLVEPGSQFHLRDIDPDDTSLVPGGKEEGLQKNARISERLDRLQELLYAENRHRVLIVLQGMDTSGKDGLLKFLMTGFDANGVRVTSFKKPSELELDHDYLWRIHAQTPGRGEIAVFNRSHYEDVLVVRVHELVPRSDWSRRYQQINDFERMLSENGTLILKFFLHISKGEQKKRLEDRIEDPTKRWKFQHGDLEERKLWPKYQKAYEDALAKTSTRWAPWHVVPANAKWYRNYVVGSVVADALEGLKMKYPQPDLRDVVVK